MTIKLYQVDAFTNKVFSGNPSAVCPLPNWIDPQRMQNIAMENNQAETAFIVKKDDAFEIRWFTPTVEVDLCGHATLASAHVLFNHEGYKGNEIAFHSPRSGLLKVYRNDDLLTLDFPADRPTPVTMTPELLEPFNIKPIEAYRGKTDLMLVFETESQIRNLKPDLAGIKKMPCRGVIVTSRGDNCDFVSRFFAPQSGIDEDPVTGSAHTTLTPYWSKRLNKTELVALQLSKREGHLICKHNGDRVHISGQARTYLVGDIVL